MARLRLSSAHWVLNMWSKTPWTHESFAKICEREQSSPGRSQRAVGATVMFSSALDVAGDTAQVIESNRTRQGHKPVSIDVDVRPGTVGRTIVGAALCASSAHLPTISTYWLM